MGQTYGSDNGLKKGINKYGDFTYEQELMLNIYRRIIANNYFVFLLQKLLLNKMIKAWFILLADRNSFVTKEYMVTFNGFDFI